jgi:L-galactose dehydrogenase
VKYRQFGKTDMRVAEVGLGGGYITGKGNDTPDEVAVAIVQRALELGCNYIDTAPLYGRHRSETCIGLALKDWNKPCYVATKVGCYPRDFDYSRDSVLQSFEESLERMQLDSVDLLQVHQCEIAGWERITQSGGALDGLRELQGQGLVRYIGVTGYDLDILIRLVETGEFDAVLNYNRYDMFTQEAKWELLPPAARHQVAYVAGSPLHSGLLGARKVSRVEQMEKRGEDTSEVRARLAHIDDLIADYPDSLSRMALRYLLSDPQVAIVIPSASNLAQVEENMAASEAGPLPPELVEAIEHT